MGDVRKRHGLASGCFLRGGNVEKGREGEWCHSQMLKTYAPPTPPLKISVLIVHCLPVRTPIDEGELLI